MPPIQEKRRIGCGTIFRACFMLSIFLAVGGGIYLYIMVPKWIKAVDENAVPFLESKGRALVGSIFLNPLKSTISASDLSFEEQDEWKAFLDETWDTAYKTDDKQLDREFMINITRDTVATRSGYYYLLKHIRNNMSNTTLTGKQKNALKHLIDDAREKLLDNTYTTTHLAPIKSDILSLGVGWRLTKERNGKKDPDHCLRDLGRHLLKLQKDAPPAGDGLPFDMDAAFRQRLATLRQTLLEALGTHSATKTQNIGGPIDVVRQNAEDTAHQAAEDLQKLQDDLFNGPIDPAVLNLDPPAEATTPNE